MCRWILGRLQGRDAPTADGEINECFAAILALANPTPEMMPEQIRALRTDAVIATGRSDYPNQVNKVLCFPYIVRSALDISAKSINRNMEMVAVRASADLAREAPDFGPVHIAGGVYASAGHVTPMAPARSTTDTRAADHGPAEAACSPAWKYRWRTRSGAQFRQCTSESCSTEGRREPRTAEPTSVQGSEQIYRHKFGMPIKLKT
jgi:malic enzyme